MIKNLFRPARQQIDAPEVEVSMDGNVPHMVNWSGRTFLVERVLDSWKAAEPADRRGQRRDYVRALTSEGELLLYKSDGRWYLDAISVDNEDGDMLGIDPVVRVVDAIQEIEKARASESEPRSARKRYTIKVIVPFSPE